MKSDGSFKNFIKMAWLIPSTFEPIASNLSPSNRKTVAHSAQETLGCSQMLYLKLSQLLKSSTR